VPEAPQVIGLVPASSVCVPVAHWNVHVGDDVTPPPLHVLTTPAVVPDAVIMMARHWFSVQVGGDGQLPSALHVIWLVLATVYSAAHVNVHVGDDVTPPPLHVLTTPAVVPDAVVVMAGHWISVQVGGDGQLPSALHVIVAAAFNVYAETHSYVQVGDDVTPPPLQVLTTPAVVPDAEVVMDGHWFSVQVGGDGQLPSALHVIDAAAFSV